MDEQTFDRLSEADGRDLVSIFIPTHPRGREVTQNPIRLKNQLKGVDDQLEHRGWNHGEREGRLEQARSLLEDREFWEHQGEGLAVYLGDEGWLDTLALSSSPSARALVLPVYQVRPLLPELEPAVADVLVLSRGEVALFAVRGMSLQREEADLPGSLDDVNWFVDREEQRQHHPDRVGTEGSRHGHEPSLQEDEDLRRFLRAVSHGVTSVSSERPLIVLGDDDVVSRFESVHGSVLRDDNGGVGGGELESEVRSRAARIMERLELEKEAARIDGARAALGTGRAVTDIAAALPDALTGRVGSVVVQHEAEPIWGRLDAGTMEVRTHETPTIGDIDLLDRLVIGARANGAAVESVGASIDDNPFVAIRRY